MRGYVLRTPCDFLTMEETLGRIADAMAKGAQLNQVSLNVAKLVKMRSNSLLREDVLAGDIISADGMGIVLAAWLTGVGHLERVAGIDLMEKVLALSARRGFRPYFLGAEHDVTEKAVDIAKQRFPGLVFAGWRDGYFKPEMETQVVQSINEVRPDCLFVGMPTPRKERFMKAHRAELNVPFVMGVGGSFDVLAGLTRRASPLMQRLGLEWFHRVLQEPRRMWWRYASTNSVFLWLLLRECFRAKQLQIGAKPKDGEREQSMSEVAPVRAD